MRKFKTASKLNAKPKNAQQNPDLQVDQLLPVCPALSEDLSTVSGIQFR